MIEQLIWLPVQILLGGLILWAAAKLTAVVANLSELFLCAAGAAVAGLIPTVGWALAIVVLFALLRHYTRADIWPDLILMVIVARFVDWVAAGAIFSLLT